MNQWIVLIPAEGGRLPERLPFAASEYERLMCGPVRAYYRRDGRFANDQLFASGGEGLAVCDGVVLNLAELKEEYGAADLAQVVRRSWEETGGTFYSKLIGPFCGAVYDAVGGTLTAYANQTGDTFVFYACAESFGMVSNDLNLIEQVMRENGLARSLDEQAARAVLSFGFQVDGRTLIREIKRVLPGEAVKLTGGSCETVRWHRFSFQPVLLSFEEAIEQADQVFRKAVKRCFDKDLEYGVREHLVDLSGGLDSRMTAWVARDMGYGPLFFMNYCQSGSHELSFASRVAAALEGQFFHKQLDDAGFLYEVDRLVGFNYGLSVYSGMTGNEQFLRSLNMELFGLEHTGQLGDVVIGSYDKTGRTTLPDGQHSLKYSRLISFEIPAEVLAGHAAFEDFAMYTRGFEGILSSHLIRRRYTYQASPFIDPEFLALCMSIPLEYRKGHKLYWAWLDAKCPQAAKLPSTRYRSSKAASFLRRARNYALRRGGSLLRKTGLANPKPAAENMNPLDYWYETLPRLRSFIEDYYRENRRLLEPYPETGHCVDRLYASKAVDKLLGLSLLAAIKRYFPEG